MKKYYLTTEREQALMDVNINPDYINGLMEVFHNERLYSTEENLPQILKDFISIADGVGLVLGVKYGLVNNVAGFVLSINGRAIFVEDFLVEDESKYDDGIEWFKRSLKTTFDKQI